MKKLLFPALILISMIALPQTNALNNYEQELSDLIIQRLSEWKITYTTINNVLKVWIDQEEKLNREIEHLRDEVHTNSKPTWEMTEEDKIKSKQLSEKIQKLENKKRTNLKFSLIKSNVDKAYKKNSKTILDWNKIISYSINNIARFDYKVEWKTIDWKTQYMPNDEKYLVFPWKDYKILIVRTYQTTSWVINPLKLRIWNKIIEPLAFLFTTKWSYGTEYIATITDTNLFSYKNIREWDSYYYFEIPTNYESLSLVWEKSWNEINLLNIIEDNNTLYTMNINKLLESEQFCYNAFKNTSETVITDKSFCETYSTDWNWVFIVRPWTRFEIFKSWNEKKWNYEKKINDEYPWEYYEWVDPSWIKYWVWFENNIATHNQDSWNKTRENNYENFKKLLSEQ